MAVHGYAAHIVYIDGHAIVYRWWEGGIHIAYVRSDLGDLKYVYKAPTIFSDDFEAGGTSRWSNTVP